MMAGGNHRAPEIVAWENRLITDHAWYIFWKLEQKPFCFLLDEFVVEVRLTLSDLNSFEFIMGINNPAIIFLNNYDAEGAVTKVIISYIFSPSNSYPIWFFI